MDCPACDTEMLAFPVSAEFSDSMPGDAHGAALCPHCLTVQPVAEPPASVPSFDPVSDAFPAGSAAVPMALVLGLLPSLATYRAELGTLLEAVERAGTDPLLVLDRLADDESVESAVNLRRRRRQLEQLI